METNDLGVPVHIWHYGLVSLSYVRISEIPEGERAAFDRWMSGQTCPLIEEAPDAVYEWDYRKWKYLVMKGKAYV